MPIRLVTHHKKVLVVTNLTSANQTCRMLFVVEYILSVELAKKEEARFGGIAKEAVCVGGEPMQFTPIWDSMATKK